MTYEEWLQTHGVSVGNFWYPYYLDTENMWLNYGRHYYYPDPDSIFRECYNTEEKAKAALLLHWYEYQRGTRQKNEK